MTGRVPVQGYFEGTVNIFSPLGLRLCWGQQAAVQVLTQAQRVCQLYPLAHFVIAGECGDDDGNACPLLTCDGPFPRSCVAYQANKLQFLSCSSVPEAVGSLVVLVFANVCG